MEGLSSSAIDDIIYTTYDTKSKHITVILPSSDILEKSDIPKIISVNNISATLTIKAANHIK